MLTLIRAIWLAVLQAINDTAPAGYEEGENYFEKLLDETNKDR